MINSLNYEALKVWREKEREEKKYLKFQLQNDQQLMSDNMEKTVAIAAIGGGNK